jgi:hypothetical protein
MRAGSDQPIPYPQSFAKYTLTPPLRHLTETADEFKDIAEAALAKIEQP